MRRHVIAALRLSASITVLTSVTAAAQEYHPSEATDLAKASQNPVGDLVSVPLQFNFLSGGGLGDGTIYTLNLQPVFPLSVGQGWNVIARPIVPYTNAPDASDGAYGLGDIQLQLFFAPAQSAEVMWGVGPFFSFPTATNDGARTGAWGLGPALVGVRQSGAFVLGALLSHLWTFADYENELPNISLLTLQPFINYNFSDGWALNFSPILTGNWTAPDGEQYTIPLGLGVSKVTGVAGQPLNLSAHYYRNVVHPEDGGTDNLRLQLTFLFPSR